MHWGVPWRVGWLAREAGVPVGAVRVALVDLERRGMVDHRDGRWQLRPQRLRAGAEHGAPGR